MLAEEEAGTDSKARSSIDLENIHILFVKIMEYWIELYRSIKNSVRVLKAKARAREELAAAEAGDSIPDLEAGRCTLLFIKSFKN